MINKIETLPHDLINKIYDLSGLYKDKFNIVMNEIEYLMLRNSSLRFKRKYQRFFGEGCYFIYHTIDRYMDCRIQSIEPEYEGTNSHMLPQYKILLLMEKGSDCYTTNNFRRARKYGNETTELTKRIF